MKDMLNKNEIKEVLDIFEELYPETGPELNHSNPFELLVATILSAQCTDIRVNKTTEKLFEELKSPIDYVNLGQEELGKRVFSCGFYKNKSKNIVETCKILLEKYDGVVPNTIEELMTLPGVGRKTANVVVSNAFNTPAIAVDTHVFRVSNRIGLADSKDVWGTEKDLMENIQRDEWVDMHHRFIYHGRRICKSRTPLCEECAVNKYCKYYKVKVKK